MNPAWSVVLGAQSLPAGLHVDTLAHRQLRAVATIGPARVLRIEVDDRGRIPAGIELGAITLHTARVNDVAPTAHGQVVFHALAPMEQVSLDLIWPRWARGGGVALVLTLEEESLSHDARLRDELVRAADVVLVDGSATAHRTVAHFGIAPDRVLAVDGAVADRTLIGYRRAVELVAIRARRRRRDRSAPPPLRVVGPMPPTDTGIADYTWDLACAAARHVPVELYDEAGASAPAVGGRPGIRPIWEMPWRVPDRDDVPPALFVLGNSEHHIRTWLALAQWGGDVFLHDVYLVGLYEHAANRRLLREPSIQHAIWWHERDRLPPTLRQLPPRRLARAEHLRYGITFVGDVVDRARRILVHSSIARDLILRVRARRADDIRIVPYGIPPPVAARPPEQGPPLVATFGSIKQGRLFVAMAATIRAQRPDVRFVFAGRLHDRRELARLVAMIRELGLSDSFDRLGHLREGRYLSDEDYRDLLLRATVAVQLREHFFGETSGSTRRDCLAAGVPTITNAVGTQLELPDSAVVRVPAAAEAGTIAQAVLDLLADDDRRARLSHGARAYAAEHTFAQTARAVLEAIGAPSTGGDALS